MRESGNDIFVVIVTDGGRGVAQDLVHTAKGAQLRENESRAGLAEIGVEEFEFWGYRDSAVPMSGDILTRYQGIVAEIRPGQILLPHPSEEHPDHRRVTRGLLKALEGEWEGELLFYETERPLDPVNYYFDTSDVLEKQLNAMAAHQSQSQVQKKDYVEQLRLFSRLRGVAGGYEAAEAYLQYEWDGQYENFFAARPLISVIVRSDDLPFLHYSLSSLLFQRYDQFEVLVVWFGSERPDLEPFNQLDIRLLEGKASRSYNLNLGLDAARGEYIAFLDHDDVLYPGHFADLLSELQAQPTLDLVYGGYRLVGCRREGNQVYRQQVFEEINQVWSPQRLLLGNVIPIHSLLFRAGLFHGNRFDEALEAYEDWDMLARFAGSNKHFGHVDTLSCEYRIYSQKGDQNIDEIHADRGYLEWTAVVLDKIQSRLSAENFSALAQLNENYEDEINELKAGQITDQSNIGRLTQQIDQYQTLEDLLGEGCKALGIEESGRMGIARMICRGLPEETFFSILLPVCDTDPTLLRQTLLSVRNQLYPGWELCIVDDASEKEEVRTILEALRGDPHFKADRRLKILYREERGGISVATNDALALGQAPYVLFLDHDDLLHPEALLRSALALQQRSDTVLLYTDSRKIDHAGQVMDINHKPDWSPETLLHHNYINHLTIVRRDWMEAVDGLDTAFDGSQDWALLLALMERGIAAEQVAHISEPLYDWRATRSSVAYAMDTKPWAVDAAQSLLKSHLLGRGLEQVEIQANREGIGFVPLWDSGELPAVDIVIPTHTNVRGLHACLEGLWHTTDYPNRRIFLLANRPDEAMRVYLKGLIEQRREVTILDDNSAFNWAALNNQAIVNSENPLILCLNDDVKPLEKGWLQQMVRYLLLEGVGVVGATLLYPSGEPQHNGIRTDMEFVATNISEWGGKGELSVSRNVSAVTGACMLFQREVWQDCGGFDEQLPVAFNDVDFCLNARDHGWRIVQVYGAELIHHENVTYNEVADHSEKQAMLAHAQSVMREKWGDALKERYFSRYEVRFHETRMLNVS